MSGKRREPVGADEPFTSATWATVVDLEQTTGKWVHLSSWPTRRQGVYKWRMSFDHELTVTLAWSICAVEGEYPNATAGSLAAFLYALSIKLSHLVADWQHDQAMQAGKQD